MTAVVFGLAPALHISKTNVNDVLKEGGRAGGSLRARRWTSGLIVGELALTLVLLAVDATLLDRTLRDGAFDREGAVDDWARRSEGAAPGPRDAGSRFGRADQRSIVADDVDAADHEHQSRPQGGRPPCSGNAPEFVSGRRTLLSHSGGVGQAWINVDETIAISIVIKCTPCLSSLLAAAW